MALKFVSLVWIWFLLHWLLMAADEDVQLSDAARSAMIDIIADCSDLVKYMADRLSSHSLADQVE